MEHSSSTLARDLVHCGWRIELNEECVTIPKSIGRRYEWLPYELTRFLQAFKYAISPTGKAWMITCANLCDTSEMAFAWNQWERDSLSAAKTDSSLQDEIRSFWDRHFPILMSVRNCYAYCAIRNDLVITGGEEPEYEDCEIVASNYVDFLERILVNDPRFDRWL